MKCFRFVFYLCVIALFGWFVGSKLSSRWDRVDGEDALVASGRKQAEREASVGQLGQQRANDGMAAEPKINYPANSIRGEVVVQFNSHEDWYAYLQALEDAGIQPLSRIDELLVVRIDSKSIRVVDPRRYDGSSEFSYTIRQPLPPLELSPEALASLRGYGISARQIVGDTIEGDGAGVMVAILDSGISEHAQFDDVNITAMDLVGGGIDSEGSGHGTSVASIISGSEGIVSNADLLVVRVLGEDGIGNSFHLAEGIVKATDQGAHIINMSVAVYEDSPLLRQAVSYANSQGVILVAATGNDGYTCIAYPSAYEAVLAVTAVDANGKQALFPNQSTTIDVAAPGVSILTANEDLGTIPFTGTSAAAPFVSGTLAAMLSADPQLSSQQAVDTLKRHLNDAGASGEDAAYGDGVIDWDRLYERSTPNIVDIALAEIYLDRSAQPGTTMPIEVTVQNRGTAWTSESQLQVIVGGGEPVEFTVGSLAPGAITSRKVYSSVPAKDSESGLSIAARIIPEDIEVDIRLENNLKAVEFKVN